VYRKTHTVLLINNNVRRLDIWSAELRTYGFQSVCATSSAEAIKKFNMNVSAIAVALTPEESLEFLLAVRDRYEGSLLACAETSVERLKQLTYGCTDMVMSKDWIPSYTAISALIHEGSKWRREQLRDIEQRDQRMPRPARLPVACS
jgi:hypothetical protein